VLTFEVEAYPVYRAVFEPKKQEKDDIGDMVKKYSDIADIEMEILKAKALALKGETKAEPQIPTDVPVDHAQGQGKETLSSENEKPFGPPTAENEIDVRKLRDELPFHAYLMKVLCRDEMGKLNIAKTIKEIKYIGVSFTKESAPSYYDVVTDGEDDYEDATIGLFLTS
jgi:hypothetical protein